MHLFFKYWGPTILWACLISYFSTSDFSSANTSRILGPFFHWLFPHQPIEFHNFVEHLIRKLAHWSEYFILAILLYRGFRHGRDTHWERRWAFWTLVLVFLYAVGDEIHQLWVPSRSGRFQDSLLDFFGGTCALAVLYLRYRMDQREPGNGYNHSK